MAIEINNNFIPKKAASLDARLNSVINEGALPDPNIAANFIYEGAQIYTITEKTNFQAQEDPDNLETLIWVNIGSGDCCVQVNIGSITVATGTGNLNMEDVVPPIATCHTVNIVITGGTTYTVNSIIDAPLGQVIKFVTNNNFVVTFTHTDLELAGANDIVMEIGLDYVMSGRTIANESLTLVNEGSAMSQVTGEQFVSLAAFCEALAGLNVTVIDALTSTSSSAALSANQGHILAEILSEKQNIFAVSGLLEWNNDGTGLTAAYPDFIYTTSQANIINVGTYLISTFTGTTKHRLAKVLGNTLLHGVWLLPGGKNPSIFLNWLQLSSSTNITKSYARIPITPELLVNGSTAEADGQYFLRLNKTNTLAFGSPNIVFNPANSDTQKVNIRLTVGKSYDVSVMVECITDEWQKFVFRAYQHTNFGDIINAMDIPQEINAWPTSVTGVAGSLSIGTYLYNFRVSPISLGNIYSFAWEPRLGVVSPNTISRQVVGGMIMVKEVENFV